MLSIVLLLLNGIYLIVATSVYGNHLTRPNYDFSYKVFDASKGQDFGHAETRNFGRTYGEYYVMLPDGRRQIVSYYADDTGFHPHVTYVQSASNQNFASFVLKPNFSNNLDSGHATSSHSLTQTSEKTKSKPLTNANDYEVSAPNQSPPKPSSYVSLPYENDEKVSENGWGVANNKKSKFSDEANLNPPNFPSTKMPYKGPTSLFLKVPLKEDSAQNGLGGKSFYFKNYFAKSNLKKRKFFSVFSPKETLVSESNHSPDSSISDGDDLKSEPKPDFHAFNPFINNKRPKQISFPRILVVNNHENEKQSSNIWKVSNKRYKFSKKANGESYSYQKPISKTTFKSKFRPPPNQFIPVSHYENKFSWKPIGYPPQVTMTVSTPAPIYPVTDTKNRVPTFFNPIPRKPKFPNSSKRPPFIFRPTKPSRIIPAEGPVDANKFHKKPSTPDININLDESVVPRIVPVIVPVEDDLSPDYISNSSNEGPFTAIGDYLDEDYL